MKLFFRLSGQGRPLIILHGLFGSSDNWFSLAKEYAKNYTVYLLDQRNHGQSPHSEELNYELLIEDLHQFIKEQDLLQPDIIGHSMGGKVAMGFAIKYPNLLRKLIVVDILPKQYPIHHDTILVGLKSINISELKSRNQADEQLLSYVPNSGVRQFLLKNLGRNSDQKFEWKMNLKAIDKHIHEMSEGLPIKGFYQPAALFILGSRSNYFSPGDEKIIHEFFPHAEISFLDTSHWVHAEKPVEFAELTLNFINR